MVLQNHHTRMLRRRCMGRAYVIHESSKTRNGVTPMASPRDPSGAGEPQGTLWEVWGEMPEQAKALL